ncbi:hypothetical protein BDV18DRAFT_160661 [Aspergillus unguis]
MSTVECMTLSHTTVMDPSTDKKRNKLGYHRTSVACVHCRRRKIRCLVAAEDPQGRCENCIRLRKECQFFPVDQQPPVEKKARPSSRIETISNDPSTASSSPPTVTGEADAYYPYHPMPLSAGPEMATFNTGYANPMAPYAPDASTPMDPSVPWDEFTTLPSDPQLLANMAAQKQMVNMPHHVWSQPATPIAAMPPNSAPLPGAPTVPSQPQGQPLSPASPYAVQPDGSVWQIPQNRSMTFPAQPNITSYPSPSPGPPGAGGFAQPMPNLKRSVTSPGHGYHTAMHPQSPTADMTGTSLPVTYAAQASPMGYPAWQEVGVPAVNMVPYPVYTDASQQSFGGSPMGAPGQPQ